jgi:hypothetical protein
MGGYRIVQIQVEYLEGEVVKRSKVQARRMM